MFAFLPILKISNVFFRGFGKKLRFPLYGSSHVNGKDTLKAAVRGRAERTAYAAKVSCAFGWGILSGHFAILGKSLRPNVVISAHAFRFA